jgi:hypothetical protein
MNQRRVARRRKVGLGLAAVLTAAAIPAYAIADGIVGGRTDKPDPAQIKLRVPSQAELTQNAPASVLRAHEVRLESGPASAPVTVETPDSVRKRPSRLGP